jgi:hypothetical protein
MRKARELLTGEMIRNIFGEDDQWFFHYYWKVVGHKHEEKKGYFRTNWWRTVSWPTKRNRL